MTAKKTATSKSVAAVKKTTSAAVLRERENELAKKALEMRREGKTMSQVATELKLTVEDASNKVSNALKQAAALIDEGAKQEIMALEMDRYDLMQQNLWALALAGDIKAVETILKISDRRLRILGLDGSQTNSITNNTIVVAGTGDEYLSALKRIAETPKIIEYEE
jgi:uncharacterized protein (DUF1501 family)